ncbi:MAG: hypothetical protein P4L22_06650 [Candidatus Babeliales bacterium]|nr:hypothetical protein [Candidatus Babeliales bacterium]
MNIYKLIFCTIIFFGQISAMEKFELDIQYSSMIEVEKLEIQYRTMNDFLETYYDHGRSRDEINYGCKYSKDGKLAISSLNELSQLKEEVRTDLQKIKDKWSRARPRNHADSVYGTMATWVCQRPLELYLLYLDKKIEVTQLQYVLHKTRQELKKAKERISELEQNNQDESRVNCNFHDEHE